VQHFVVNPVATAELGLPFIECLNGDTAAVISQIVQAVFIQYTASEKR
jgi:hypothetical protein